MIPVRPQNMKQLGKLGGRKPKMTALCRTAAEHDDSLREQARQVLARALAGEDVPKAAFDQRAASLAIGPTRRPSVSNRASSPSAWQAVVTWLTWPMFSSSLSMRPHRRR
jgi:plasmid stability protein